MRRSLLWAIPAGLLLAAAATLLALPGFVAAQNHRPAIEAFASGLVGRQVHIGGQLSLRFLPRPALSATDIMIAGPHDETIKARGLALEISLPALLRGQLAARTLYLDHPVISFPWPLPGGPRAVAPPPLLAALHAHLADAQITLGPEQLSSVTADIQTSAGGGVSGNASGTLLGLTVSLQGALGPLALDGSATLSLQADSLGARAQFTGLLNSQGAASGQLSLTLPQNISASASVTASQAGIIAGNIQAQQTNTTLSGSASLTAAGLSTALLAQNLNLDDVRNTLKSAGWVLPPLRLSLTASNAVLLGQNFPALQASLTAGPGGISIASFSLTLPGGATLAGNAAADAAGALSGQAGLMVPDSAALLAGYHLPPLRNWPSAHLTAQLGGTLAQPALKTLSGTLGPDHVQGSLIFAPGSIGGQLSFDHLAVPPLAAWAAWAAQRPQGKIVADIELSAARAEAGKLKLSDLALDASLDGTLNIRRISAHLYGGLAAGSFTLNDAGQVSAAQGFADIPSAAPLAVLVPPGYALPPALLAQPFTLRLAARGPAQALAAAAEARLGQFTITAAPTLNLAQGSATGALTLEHPEAILVARYFGFDQALAFPGAGSASLRARFTASASSYGLNDFVLSFGALNASGRVMVQNGVASGQIDATSLLVPPIPAGLEFPAALALQGKISFTADQLLYAGRPLWGASAGHVSWSAAGASLALDHAQFGGGTLQGTVNMVLSPSAAPAFTAQMLAQNIDAAAAALPLAFPYPLSSGRLNAAASLTASGYGPKILLATLGGTATLTASNGTLRGFTLEGFGDALGTPDAVHKLYHALITGSTSFTSLSLAASFAQGNCTLDRASLNSPAGQVSASGSIDLYDNAQALRLILTPANVDPPLSATMLVLGTWAVPKHIAHMKAALAWKPRPPPSGT